MWEAVAKHRAAAVPVPPLPATAAEQVAREAAAEDEVRTLLRAGGFLSQPDRLRRYLNAELPAYLAPLRFLGVCDDLTDEFRLDADGVSYVPPPSPDLPYFYAANARDPRAGIVHEGAHYQQLSLSNAHPNPIRRRYYDSGPNEGIAFYNEEYLLQAGLFDDAPHTRAVIWNFARLRALRVEADVHLATGAMSLDDAVDFFVRRVPMDRQTAFEESCFYAGNPGLALSYQTGKLQLIEPRRRGRRGRRRRRSRCAGSTTPSGSTATSRSRCCAGSCSATARCSTPSTPIRRPAHRRQCRRGAVDARRRQAAELRCAACRAGDPPDGRRAGAERVRLGVGERPRRHAGDGDAPGIPTPPTVWRRGRTDEPWYDSIVALAMAAAVTEHVELGTAVLVLPQRNPVVLAKQVASLDRLAGGRVVLGVGAGWLAEEFAALATPFDSRGSRTDEWIDLLRACWTGRPEPLRRRPLPAAGRRRVRADARPADPDPRRRDDAAGAATGAPARRRLARHPAGRRHRRRRHRSGRSAQLDGVGRRVLRIVGSAGLGRADRRGARRPRRRGHHRRRGRRRLGRRRRRPGRPAPRPPPADLPHLGKL